MDPLDPTDPTENRYVELQEADRGAVDKIFSGIALAHVAGKVCTQLLSGPSGSGKTTELYRLKGRLEDAGFTVVLVDSLRFVNHSYPIDPTELLIAMGLAFGEQLPGDEQAEATRGFTSRFWDFLRRVKVSIDVGPVSASASAEQVKASIPGVSIGIDLKGELKSSEPFVTELRRKLAFHLSALYDEVARFFQELTDEHRRRHPDSLGVVMIFDSLEKLRGIGVNANEVEQSVQRLFVHHSDTLRFDSHHMVYTVPPP